MIRLRWPIVAAAAVISACALHVAGAVADGPPTVTRELHFARGAASVVVADSVVRGERHVWRFGARAGQTATVRVTAVEDNAAFTIWQPGARLPATRDADIEGRTLTGAGEEDDAATWHGRLPASGNYLVVVGATRGNASYKLTLEIAPDAPRRE